MVRLVSLFRAVAVAAGVLLLITQNAAAQTDYSEEKLVAFVDAAIAVSNLIDEWRPRIQAAENDDQAEVLAQEADTALVSAIEGTNGISIAEYQQIIEDIGQDPSLSERVRSIFNEKGGAQ